MTWKFIDLIFLAMYMWCPNYWLWACRMCLKIFSKVFSRLSERFFFILTQRVAAHIAAMAFYNYGDSLVIVLGSSVVICTEYVTQAWVGNGSEAGSGTMSLHALLTTLSQI